LYFYRCRQHRYTILSAVANSDLKNNFENRTNKNKKKFKKIFLCLLTHIHCRSNMKHFFSTWLNNINLSAVADIAKKIPPTKITTINFSKFLA
jgi:hypothetical protein